MHSAISTTMPPPVPGAALEGDELDRLLAYWNAANYLTVAQIYLSANPLLREPLRAEHIKPRLLGYWGTSPGLNLVYAQLNRLIRRTGQEVLYIAGPSHGGPAVVANVYIEGCSRSSSSTCCPTPGGAERTLASCREQRSALV